MSACSKLFLFHGRISRLSQLRHSRSTLFTSSIVIELSNLPRSLPTCHVLDLRHCMTISSVARRHYVPNTNQYNFQPSRHYSFGPRQKVPQDDYYRRLEIGESASADEIKSAFIRLSKLHHPDVSNSDEALDNFLKIREAYDVLSNNLKRKEYDKQRGISKTGRKGASAVQSQGWRERRQREREREKVEEENRFRDFDDEDEFVDIRKAKWQRQQEAKRYKPNWEPRPEGEDPHVYEAKLMWFEYSARFRAHVGRNRNFYRCALVVFLGILWRDYRFYLPIYGERKTEEFRKSSVSDHEHWIWSDFSRRWKWKQNIDRLPEMVEEERKTEKEQLLEKYKRENPETEE